MLKKTKRKLFYFFSIILFFAFIKACVFDVKKISGTSMEPSLKAGNYVLIFKAAYGIKHPLKNKYIFRWARPKSGDIIVYLKDGHFTVKRCLAISEEPIEFSKKLGYNYDYSMKVSGKDIPLTAVQFRNLGGMSDEKKVRVPAGYVLALGDNLKESYDSRDYGFVAADGIYGKVFIWKK